jgi:hypothetical protein
MTEPSDSEKAGRDFLLEQYKSLRAEIALAASQYETAVRYYIILVAASFVFAVELKKAKEFASFDKLMFCIGVSLLMLWICKVARLLDDGTVRLGDFLRSTEKEFLGERAQNLGWQTNYHPANNTRFCKKRSPQRILIFLPTVIYPIFLVVFFFRESLLRWCQPG